MRPECYFLWFLCLLLLFFVVESQAWLFDVFRSAQRPVLCRGLPCISSMAKERSRNTLDAVAYSKILKANIDCLKEEEFNVTDLDIVCCTYKGFLLDIAEHTLRIAKVPLFQGAKHAFARATAGQCEAFANKMVSAMQWCNEKSKSATTCGRLKDGTKQIVKHFDYAQGPF